MSNFIIDSTNINGLKIPHQNITPSILVGKLKEIQFNAFSCHTKPLFTPLAFISIYTAQWHLCVIFRTTLFTLCA